MANDIYPRRGEIFAVDLGNDRRQRSSEQRPCIVIQNDLNNRLRDLTIVVLMTKLGGRERLPFVISLEPGTAGLQGENHVNRGQIYTISVGHLQQKLGVLSPSQMAEVEKGILYAIGLGSVSHEDASH